MRIKFTLCIFAFSLIFTCNSDFTKNSFSNNDVDMIIQEFTTARINQYLYSSEPKDNSTLMVFLIKQHGYGYKQFIEKLKNKDPELYRKLFIKAGN